MVRAVAFFHFHIDDTNATTATPTHPNRPMKPMNSMIMPMKGRLKKTRRLSSAKVLSSEE